MMNHKRIFLLTILVFTLSFLFADDYSRMWSRMDRFRNDRLPKSAKAVVDSIYIQAVRENNIIQRQKALIHKLMFINQLEENSFTIERDLVLKEIETAPPDIQALLHSMLGEMYWTYYQQRQDFVLERTSISGGNASDDIETMDAQQILENSIMHYSQSLNLPEKYRNKSLNEYKPLVLPDPNKRLINPVFYDFLAIRAIDQFTNSESSIARPREEFIINDHYLIPAEEFANMNIETSDTLSLHFQTLNTYQKLTRFHLHDDDPRALLQIESKRLDFVINQTSSSNAERKFIELMQFYMQQYKGVDISSYFMLQLATFYYNRQFDEPQNPAYQDYLKIAHQLCQQIIDQVDYNYPTVFECRRLKNAIDIQYFYVSMDSELPIKQSIPITITYRNTKRLTINLYEWDEEHAEKNKAWWHIDYKHYQAMKPYKTYEIELPETDDFLEHSTIGEIKPLSSGEYIIEIVVDPKRREQSRMERFKVSDIALLDGMPHDIKTLTFVDRNDGLPLNGAEVEFHRNHDEEPFNTITTNANGEVSIDESYGGFICSYKKDKYIALNASYRKPQEHYDLEQPVTKVYYFIDRKIYRPGQTVYYKGIIVQKKSSSFPQLREKKTVTVNLMDTQGRTINSTKQLSNEFGSFSGSFIIPDNAGTGTMSLGSNTGNVNFQVEEYKRPKFEVEFQPVKDVFRLGSPIEIKGKAESFAGTGISDAEVTYYVKRVSYYPWFSYRYIPPVNEKVIASGKTTTAPDGSFTIPFILESETKRQHDQMSAYQFVVTADVIDMNGETRSAETSVMAGDRSLILDVAIGETVHREGANQFDLITDNLMNQHIPVSGIMIFSKLKTPNRIFREPTYPNEVDQAMFNYDEFVKKFPHDPYLDENDSSKWEVEKTIYSGRFDSGEKRSIALKGLEDWQPGVYRVELIALDPFGEEVRVAHDFTVYSEKGKELPRLLPFWVQAINTTCNPGEKARFLIGTSYHDAMIQYYIKCDDDVIVRKALRLDNEQVLVELPVEEWHRGGLQFGAFMCRENRNYAQTIQITVPWSNMKLDIEWLTFRDFIEPGSKERFSLRIKNHKGKSADAELLVAMYDSSLDQYNPNNWAWNVFSQFRGNTGRYVSTGGRPLDLFWSDGSSGWHRYRHQVSTQDRLNWFGYYLRWYTTIGMVAYFDNIEDTDTIYPRNPGLKFKMNTMDLEQEDKAELAGGGASSPPPVQIRSNFAETAFFYPELRTNKDGEIEFTFTVPDALTRWKLLGLAHTQNLMSGLTEKYITTQKKLMVTPNLPRFLREGDQIALSTKIASMVDEALEGTVELQLFNAENMQRIDAELGNVKSKQAFSIKPQSNAAVEWEITIPSDFQAVVVRIIAQSGNYSDGEEHLLPVLPNRMLVTESLPLPVRGNQTKDFTFDKLTESGSSESLKHHQLTLEFTTNPVWYVVQTLPYMAEYPYECAEQIFTRYYANALAGYIIQQNPKIERIFKQWKDLPDSKALLSNLEKNQDLKALLLEETPWVRQANNETERKKRIALLFDMNHMSMSREKALEKLFDMQLPSGAWPWFSGMKESRYITQYIVEGFSHLKALGVEPTPEIKEHLVRAIRWMDSDLTEDYERLIENDVDLKTQNIGNHHIHYFYMRNVFQDIPIDDENKVAFDYYFDQLKTWWKGGTLHIECMQALALNRYNEPEIPRKIVASLRERAQHSDEMGMYWKENRGGYFWFNAPIETQSLLIELFNEMGTKEEVDELRVWLLKQKQVQDWKTTKATAEACYAMLLRGSDWLSEDKPVAIELGNHKIEPESMEPGTGYIRETWTSKEIEPAMGNVHIENPNDHPAWGALYWQYFEDLDKITQHDTPLSLKKQLFIERRDDQGVKLHPITEGDPIRVGDRVIVRIELRVDREMEYVHMKDMRASGFEPENVISSTKWQQGLVYFESTRDAATNFFFERLHKGTFVFEYPLRAFQAGIFSNGITTIQCMYAPEFTSHSEGIRIKINRKD